MLNKIGQSRITEGLKLWVHTRQVYRGQNVFCATIQQSPPLITSCSTHRTFPCIYTVIYKLTTSCWSTELKHNRWPRWICSSSLEQNSAKSSRGGMKWSVGGGGGIYSRRGSQSQLPSRVGGSITRAVLYLYCMKQAAFFLTNATAFPES
jgi:hypothetical protein